MIYGYINIQNPAQSEKHQEDILLKAYKDIKIYKEDQEGQVLKQILKQGKDGDTLVLKDILKFLINDISSDTDFNTIFDTINNTIQDFFNKGMDIELIDTPVINTSIYRKAIMDNLGNDNSKTLAAVSELLSSQIRIILRQEVDKKLTERESIKTGIKSSKKHIGLKKGTKLITKKEIASKKYIKEHLSDLGGDLSNSEIMENLHLARNTYFKYKREVLEEKGLHMTKPKIKDTDISGSVKTHSSVSGTDKKETASSVTDKPVIIEEKTALKSDDVLIEKTDNKKNKKETSPKSNDIIEGQMSLFDF